MERRDFVRLTGTAAGAIAVPIPGWRDGGLVGALTPIPAADKKALADVALNTGRARGATYVDVRIARATAAKQLAERGAPPVKPGYNFIVNLWMSVF